MTSVRQIIFGWVAVSALALPATAHAAGYATDDRGRLYEVLPRKNATRLVGTVQVKRAGATHTPTLTDLALSYKKGMYGISFSALYKIDFLDPSQSTFVGSLGASLNALAFDKDNVLWATGGSALYRVDLTTGRAKRVGSFGGVGTSDGDLAFVDGTLYATLSGAGGTHLATLDPKTGRAKSVGVIRAGPARALYGVWGLIWDGRTLYALTSSGGVFKLDTAKAIAKPLFAARARFYGACPAIRF